MEDSECVDSLWHNDCELCDHLLKIADFRKMRDTISNAIVLLHWKAQSLLIDALSNYFGDDWDKSKATSPQRQYLLLLDKADQHLAKCGPIEEREKLHSAVKLLQSQFITPGQLGTLLLIFMPCVEMLEKVIESMKMITVALGLNSCADQIGNLLYDPNGPEKQALAIRTVLVHKQNCTTNEHVRLSKIALEIAHPAPGSKGAIKLECDHQIPEGSTGITSDWLANETRAYLEAKYFESYKYECLE